MANEPIADERVENEALPTSSSIVGGSEQSKKPSRFKQLGERLNGTFSHLSRRQWLAIGLIVLAVVVFFVSRWAYVAVVSNAQSKPISNRAFTEREADYLSKSLESQSPEMKQQTLQALVESEYRLGEYRQARQHYEQWLKLVAETESVDSATYLLGATLYNKLGDKAAAKVQLANAQRMVDGIADPAGKQAAQDNLELVKANL